MREILFRAKRVDNGERVEGYLLITQISGAYIMGTVRNVQNQKRGGVSVGDKIWQHEVDPATIGQYTEKRDIQFNRIFEGDKVENVRAKWIGRVEFNDGSFVVICDQTGNKWPLTGVRAEQLRIIGNIHGDTP